MVKKGGGKSGLKPKKTSKTHPKPSKKPAKAKKTTITRHKIQKPEKRVPIAAKKQMPAAQTAPPSVEQRILKKLPPAKPGKTEPQAFRIFGHNVEPRKIKDAAIEAYNKRCYTIDDINVDQFIRDKEWDNLITKIGVLDRIEEQLVLLYPHIDVVRKDKTSIELYLK
jgi:hypothetical protein